jgi:ubiquinone/menaquinone biosynthesis C-methylase UbiE
MRVDNSWDRYFGKENDLNYKRYAYSVSHLFGSVLDVGCGDGFGAMLMTKNKDVKSIIGIDIQREAIERAKVNLKNTNVHVLKAEAENLPFTDGSFDCVHCGQTLEHVRDDVKTIQEIQRVVKERVIFSVPINGGLSEQHVREYESVEQFENMISEYFMVISVKMFLDEKRRKRLVLIAER